MLDTRVGVFLLEYICLFHAGIRWSVVVGLGLLGSAGSGYKLMNVVIPGVIQDDGLSCMLSL
jgi:hypothetical protein